MKDQQSLMLNEFNTINYSPSCDRNKVAIAEQLLDIFSNSKNIIEVGSLSGQHAAYFCEKLPHLNWQPTDLPENIAALQQNISQLNNPNINDPVSLNVSDYNAWPDHPFDTIFTANTLHIMSWQHVQAMFANIGSRLNTLNCLCVYGPFKYQGQFTSESNANFELWLKGRDQNSGIRDFEHVNSLAQSIGFKLESDIAMPANNQLIIWRR